MESLLASSDALYEELERFCPEQTTQTPAPSAASASVPGNDTTCLLSCVCVCPPSGFDSPEWWCARIITYILVFIFTVLSREFDVSLLPPAKVL